VNYIKMNVNYIKMNVNYIIDSHKIFLSDIDIGY
jgi:hypothetical protein